jgi:RNA polymerase sigma-70 factor (ECF subfamily)
MTSGVDESDAERVRDGDRAAFAALVKRHQASLFGFARTLTGDAARAEDAVQQTFLTLWRVLTTSHGDEDGRSIDNVRAWLFTTTRHALARQFRRRSGEPAHFEDVATLAERAGFAADDPETLSSHAEEKEQLMRALMLLDEEEREVVWLRDVEGMTGEDVAGAIGITVPAMKSRLHRARMHLMALLRAQPNDEAHHAA